MAGIFDTFRTSLANRLAPQARAVAYSEGYARSVSQWQAAFMGGIRANGDQLLAVKGGGDLKLWRSLLDDDMAYSTFQQRRAATISRPWEIDPGGERPIDQEAAEFIRSQCNRVGWDRVCDKMLFALWYGYGVGEPIYAYEDGKIVLERIDVPDRAWFGFDGEGKLMLRDPLGIGSITLPDQKFWVVRCGNDNDFQYEGQGLAHWAYWPIFFKRNMLPFWLRFLEKFGSPTVLGKVSGGQLDDETRRTEILKMLAQVSSESQVAVPDWLETELLSASGAGGSHEALLKRMDSAITRVVLSQTMTTDNGSSRSQSETHMDVRDEVVRADSDLLHESFNRSIVQWLVDWNFPGAAYPRVYRVMGDEEDLTAIADRDTTLKALGWVRNEESFHETYGEGFERVAEVAPVAPLLLPAPDPAPTFAAIDGDAIDALVARMAADGDAAVQAMADTFAAALEGVTDPEVARIAMLDVMEKVDPAAFAKLLAMPMTATRALEEAGL